MRRRVAQLLGGTAVWAAALFVSAGTVRWPRAWLCLGLQVVLFIVTWLVVSRANPGVIEARGKRKQEGTKGFDIIFSRVYTALSLIAAAVAGLDAVRFRWSATSSEAAAAAGIVYVLGSALVMWTMAVNPFLETAVRIQKDRGHHVVSRGPYRFVRHPMYVGMLVSTLAAPAILGSLWAYVPAAFIVAAFVWRTMLEDRTLRAELEGYEEYAARTRYRLVPGLW